MSKLSVSLEFLIALHRNLYQLEENENRLSRESRLEICELLHKARFGELTPEERQYIIDKVSEDDLEQSAKIIKKSESRRSRIITWFDRDYPFSAIADLPPIVYVRGEIPDPIKYPYVAIVGSRKASGYGREMVQQIVHDLAPYNVTIVSGLAYGIDGEAHRAALKNGLHTIAFLGCGIDVMYPACHRELSEQISLKGAVVSEFPWGTPPLKHNFPMRNRLISGLSRAVVVVEAIIRSGSLITARWAADQGREVFAVPGNVGRNLSSGTNALIKDGAHLIESGTEIAQVLGLQKSATSDELKKNSGHTAEDNDIKLALTEFLKSGGNNLEKLLKETGLGVNELLPLITEAELSNKTGW